MIKWLTGVPGGRPRSARALLTRCSLVPASIAITPSLVVMNEKSAKSYPWATWTLASGLKIFGVVKRKPSSPVIHQLLTSSRESQGSEPSPDLLAASAA